MQWLCTVFSLVGAFTLHISKIRLYNNIALRRSTSRSLNWRNKDRIFNKAQFIVHFCLIIDLIQVLHETDRILKKLSNSNEPSNKVNDFDHQWPNKSCSRIMISISTNMIFTEYKLFWSDFYQYYLDDIRIVLRWLLSSLLHNTISIFSAWPSCPFLTKLTQNWCSAQNQQWANSSGFHFAQYKAQGYWHFAWYCAMT